MSIVKGPIVARPAINSGNRRRWRISGDNWGAWQTKRCCNRQLVRDEIQKNLLRADDAQRARSRARYPRFCRRARARSASGVLGRFLMNACSAHSSLSQKQNNTRAMRPLGKWVRTSQKPSPYDIFISSKAGEASQLCRLMLKLRCNFFHE